MANIDDNSMDKRPYVLMPISMTNNISSNLKNEGNVSNGFKSLSKNTQLPPLNSVPFKPINFQSTEGQMPPPRERSFLRSSQHHLPNIVNQNHNSTEKIPSISTELDKNYLYLPSGQSGSPPNFLNKILPLPNNTNSNNNSNGNIGNININSINNINNINNNNINSINSINNLHNTSMNNNNNNGMNNNMNMSNNMNNNMNNMNMNNMNNMSGNMNNINSNMNNNMNNGMNLNMKNMNNVNMNMNNNSNSMNNAPTSPVFVNNKSNFTLFPALNSRQTSYANQHLSPIFQGKDLNNPIYSHHFLNHNNHNNHNNNNNNNNDNYPTKVYSEKLSTQALYNMTQFQHYEKEKQKLVTTELDHLGEICQKEQMLVENYKPKLNNPHIQPNELDALTKQFNSEITSLWEKKSRVLSYIVEGGELTTPFKQAQHPSSYPFDFPLKENFVPRKLAFLQQPSETAVANRYMFPAPAVCIVPSVGGTSSTYIVCASLAYHEGMDEEIATTMDGKHEMLQGIKKVTIDSSGSAVFSKLKIMEVSSKHKHQPFCLVFSLEEYTDQGNKNVVTSVKSAPFHVQSRSNKRKSTGSLPPAKHFMASSSLNALEYKAISSPTIPTLSKEEFDKKMNEGGEEESEEGNYIDITDLLTLPQKEAAKRLGISESMLCKRFKECTKRKWPYRYLRKIDKVINNLHVQQNDPNIEPKPKEDIERLEKFTREREEPVKIRITTGDKIQNSKWNEEEIPDEVLETLETMRKSSNSVPTLHMKIESDKENNRIEDNKTVLDDDDDGDNDIDEGYEEDNKTVLDDDDDEDIDG